MKKIKAAFVIAFIAAVSFWAGGHYVNTNPAASSGQATRAILYYTDPMNPGFRSEKPGVAPCGMPLEPVYADAGENTSLSLPPGTVRISPERQQLVGVRTAVLERQPLTYNLRLYGKVVPDETRIYRVNASTDSWIRQLSGVTTGSVVIKNQVLAEALAPAYYNAQVTYLIALDNVDRIRQQLGGQLRHQQGDLANNQIRVAVQALQNLGIGDAQVEELANTRQARPYLQVRAPSEGIVLKRNISLKQWFKAADEFYTIADIRSVWVYADVYENEVRHLSPGMAVRVRHAQLGKTFDARVSEVLPLFDPLSKTLKVRLDVRNPRYDLRPDMFVDVDIPITMPPSLNVPADAVIDSGTKNTVYVKTGDGVFEPRTVDTGWRLGRRIEITGGVTAGEKIVVSGNFLIDSESRMKTAAAALEVRTERDPVCGMDVEAEKAERAGLSATAGDRTCYFCNPLCLERFRKEPHRFDCGEPPVMDHPSAMPVMDHAASSGPEEGTGRDPVCGMDVNVEAAASAARTAVHTGRTYYFCNPLCLERFRKEPHAFIGKQPPLMDTGRDHHRKGRAAKPGMGVHKRDHIISKPDGTKKGNGPGNPARAVGVIDWDGAGAEKTDAARDWKGWGKFPGAEYLGLKQKTKNAPARPPDAQTVGKTPETSPDGLDPEHNPAMNGLSPNGTEGPSNP